MFRTMTRTGSIAIIWLLIGIAAVTGGHIIPSATAQAQQPPPAELCYAFADDGNATWRVNPSTGASSLVGPVQPAYSSIEAVALNLDASILYAVNDDGLFGMFGTIDTTTGLFTEIGPVGPGNGINPNTGNPETAALFDIDSLEMHPWTGAMWGITHTPGTNKIFRINVTTGRIVPDTFGPGIDYVEIILPNPPWDVDDLGIDPKTGRFYIIANTSGVGDFLYELNIDGINPVNSPGLLPATGQITADEIARFTYGGSFVEDVEGMSFFNDGTLYATTGDQGGVNSDRLWVVDKVTAVMAPVTPGVIDADGVDPYYNDFEGVTCLSGGASVKSGIAFEDVNSNGVFDDGTDIRYAGATVRFYRDNGNGTFDGAPTDMLVQSAVTDGSGAYSFSAATDGVFFAVLDQSTIPAGMSMTTVSVYTVNFPDYDTTLTGNNFGFSDQPIVTDTPVATLTPVPGTPGTPPPGGDITLIDPAFTKLGEPQNAIPGELVTFTIVATNTSNVTLTGVVITDGVDATFFEAVVEASTSKGTATIVNNLLVTVDVDSLVPGESVFVTLIARVRSDIVGPKTTENIVIMDSNERDPLSARATVNLAMLPATGYPPQGARQPVTIPFVALAIALAIIVSGFVLRFARQSHRS